MEIGETAKVHANVFLGHPTDPNVEGFGLRVELTVSGSQPVTTSMHPSALRACSAAARSTRRAAASSSRRAFARAYSQPAAAEETRLETQEDWTNFQLRRAEYQVLSASQSLRVVAPLTWYTIQLTA